MAKFEDLQTLWQQQPARNASPEHAAALTAAFRRYGRRNDAINGAKVVLVAMSMVFLVDRLRFHPVTLFGACLAVFAAVLFMVYDWRAQRSIARLNFADPSTGFLRKAIALLNAQRNPFRNRAFYIAMGGFWAGSNLMVLSDWPKLSIGERVIRHALITVAPLLVYRLGRFIRRKRFQSECQPLIERLTAVLHTIEADRA
jgi:hypothetical protein